MRKYIVCVDKTHPAYLKRGYSGLLAVFDLDDSCIGYISVSALGYDSVKQWMSATKWVDTGY